MTKTVMPGAAELAQMSLKERSDWMAKGMVMQLNYHVLHEDHTVPGDEGKLCVECARKAGLID